MLRLSKLVLTGVAAAGLLASSPSLAQAGLGSRLDAQEQQNSTPQDAMNLPSWARDMLAAHNAARAAVRSPALRWNPELAEHARARAVELAQLRQLVHAPRDGRKERENILQAPLGYSPSQMMERWMRERAHFRPGLFPDVSDTGNWLDVAHYTQMVSIQTTDIGCAYAPGGGFNWLVCRYFPGGNKDGKPVIALGGDVIDKGNPGALDGVNRSDPDVRAPRK